METNKKEKWSFEPPLRCWEPKRTSPEQDTEYLIAQIPPFLTVPSNPFLPQEEAASKKKSVRDWEWNEEEEWERLRVEARGMRVERMLEIENGTKGEEWERLSVEWGEECKRLRAEPRRRWECKECCRLRVEMILRFCLVFTKYTALNSSDKSWSTDANRKTKKAKKEKVWERDNLFMRAILWSRIILKIARHSLEFFEFGNRDVFTSAFPRPSITYHSAIRPFKFDPEPNSSLFGQLHNC